MIFLIVEPAKLAGTEFLPARTREWIRLSGVDLGYFVSAAISEPLEV